MKSYLLNGSSRAIGKMQPIVTAGQFFRKANGEHFTVIESSEFDFINQLRAGNGNKILDQRCKLGFNTFRIWTGMYEGAIGTRLVPDEIPNYYDKWIPRTLDKCREYNIHVDFCAYTGYNDPYHWYRLGEVVKDHSALLLLELVNEYDVNFGKRDPEGRVFRLSDYRELDGIICSHGSNSSQSIPVTPFWKAYTFHDNSAPEWWRKNGHNCMELSDSKPGLTNESTRCADNDSNEAHYYDASAASALLCGGSCFHSQQGKLSQLFTGAQLNCAKAHCDGARSVNLDCQNYPYARYDPEEYLRIYGRGPYIVKIRK